jgi:hypothetical protein
LDVRRLDREAVGGEVEDALGYRVGYASRKGQSYGLTSGLGLMDVRSDPAQRQGLGVFFAFCALSFALIAALELIGL